MIGDEGEQLLKEYVKSMSGIKDDDDKIIGFDPSEAPVKAAHLERLLFPPNSKDITDAMVLTFAYPDREITKLKNTCAMYTQQLEKAEKVIKNQQTQIDFLKSTAADLFECLMENGYERI